jgi:hypothetical protein
MPTRTPFRVTAPLVLCTLLLAAGSGACSFLFVDGPPEKHQQLPYFTCTTSRAWPVVDTVLGATYAIEAVGVGAMSTRGSGSTAGSTAGAIAGGGLAALFIVSAVSGYGKASECRDAVADLQARAARMQLQNSMGYGAGPPGSPTFQPPSQRDPWLTSPTGIFSKPPADDPAPTPPSNSPPDNDVPKKKR